MVNGRSYRLGGLILVSLVAVPIQVGIGVAVGWNHRHDGSPADPTRPRSAGATDSQNAATVARARLGGTVRLRTGETSLAVTVLAVLAPLRGGAGDTPLAGGRYIGVLVEVRDAGPGDYSSSDWADVSLYASDGSPAWHVALRNQACSDAGQLRALAPGDIRRCCVPFDLPAHTAPAEITFAPDGGFGLDSGEWTLSPAERAEARV
jgi:hypothetical protein